MVRSWGRNERIAAWVIFLGITAFGFWRTQTIANQHHTDSNQRIYTSCLASNQVRRDVLDLVIAQTRNTLPVNSTVKTEDPILWQLLQASAKNSQDFYDTASKKLAPIDCYKLAGLAEPKVKTAPPIPTVSDSTTVP